MDTGNAPVFIRKSRSMPRGAYSITRTVKSCKNKIFNKLAPQQWGTECNLWPWITWILLDIKSIVYLKNIGMSEVSLTSYFFTDSLPASSSTLGLGHHFQSDSCAIIVGGKVYSEKLLARKSVQQNQKSHFPCAPPPRYLRRVYSPSIGMAGDQSIYFFFSREE